MKHSKKNYIDPSFFINKLTYLGEKINVNVQMDVEEFFIDFLDNMERYLKEKGNHEFIELCFNGQLYQEIIGKVCKHKTYRIDNFLSLALTVQGVDNIHDSLKKYIDWEKLDGDNKYNCETCNAKVVADKRISINHLPNFLIINFKRFEYNVSG